VAAPLTPGRSRWKAAGLDAVDYGPAPEKQSAHDLGQCLVELLTLASLSSGLTKCLIPCVASFDLGRRRQFRRRPCWLPRSYRNPAGDHRLQCSFKKT